MAAKKTVKVTKAIKKNVSKPVVKAAVKTKPAAKTSAKTAVKPQAKSPEKPTAKQVMKTVPKSFVKSASKSVPKPAAEKPAKAAPKVEKTRVEKAEIDSGGTLLEMAKEEMSKVNAPIAEALEKAEKAGKFKPIKVERGNLEDEKEKWQELFKRYGKEKAVNYKMSDEFQALKPISHKVLGWGFVLTNENNRLEILFENGIKVLISNYKS